MERKIRTYKISDKAYQKALKRGNGKLATLIEEWVTCYGNGFEIARLDIRYNVPPKKQSFKSKK